jgi:hypothetical protein
VQPGEEEKTSAASEMQDSRPGQPIAFDRSKSARDTHSVSLTTSRRQVIHLTSLTRLRLGSTERSARQLHQVQGVLRKRTYGLHV